MTRRAFLFIILIVALVTYVDVQENIERENAIRDAVGEALYRGVRSGCIRDGERHPELTVERCEKIARDLVNAHLGD